MSVRLQTCGFEYSCSHVNLRFRAYFKERGTWHSGNYGVWIRSEMCTWHDKNIQSSTFCLVLSGKHFLCEASDVKCFAKMVTGWTQITIFAKTFILDVWLDSEYVSDYPGAFSIIINWCCHFESFENLFNLMSILFKFLEQDFSP